MTHGICPFADDVIVDHVQAWTAYAPGGGAKVGFADHTAGGFYNTLRDPGFWNRAGYSVHFAIALDGRICQIVNIFDRAWGQGRLGPQVTWPPYREMGAGNPNEYLISTEHEDAITENGRTKFIGSVWTPEMYAADLRVKQWCVETWKESGFDLMRFGVDSLAGHHMFDGVSRAECPGKPWREEYRERLFADLTGDNDMAFIVGNPANAGDHIWLNGRLHFIPNAVIRDELLEALYRTPGAKPPRLSQETWEFLEKVQK